MYKRSEKDSSSVLTCSKNKKKTTTITYIPNEPLLFAFCYTSIIWNVYIILLLNRFHSNRLFLKVKNYKSVCFIFVYSILLWNHVFVSPIKLDICRPSYQITTLNFGSVNRTLPQVVIDIPRAEVYFAQGSLSHLCAWLNGGSFLAWKLVNLASVGSMLTDLCVLVLTLGTSSKLSGI